MNTAYPPLILASCVILVWLIPYLVPVNTPNKQNKNKNKKSRKKKLVKNDDTNNIGISQDMKDVKISLESEFADGKDKIEIEEETIDIRYLKHLNDVKISPRVGIKAKLIEDKDDEEEEDPKTVWNIPVSNSNRAFPISNNKFNLLPSEKSHTRTAKCHPINNTATEGPVSTFDGLSGSTT